MRPLTKHGRGPAPARARWRPRQAARERRLGFLLRRGAPLPAAGSPATVARAARRPEAAELTPAPLSGPAPPPAGLSNTPPPPLLRDKRELSAVLRRREKGSLSIRVD